MLDKSHITWLQMKEELASLGGQTAQQQQQQQSEEAEEDVHHDSEVRHVPFAHQKLSAARALQQSAHFHAEMSRRRSLRFFSSDPVPMEVVENIVRTAGTAPSGAHIQPWTYVVVRTPALKQEIRELVEKEEQINYTRRMGDKWLDDLKPLMTDWQKVYLTEAPYLVLLFKHAYRLMEDGSRRTAHYNEISASISAGIFLTAVQTAGLVTLTCTWS
jgi:iodotyrosine deiodinase